MILGLFGWRCYPGGYRWHHGRTGAHMLCHGLARRDARLAVLGAALMLDDLADFPWRLVREAA